jgi:hypothetical protein
MITKVERSTVSSISETKYKHNFIQRKLNTYRPNVIPRILSLSLTSFRSGPATSEAQNAVQKYEVVFAINSFFKSEEQFNFLLKAIF